ncbi:unnamed protein product [Dicrocoelium dendriticum]|nr:unnamed protein product [Dicrocoelium dendriticum]
MSNKFAFINRKLNLNAQGCATVTGPDWQKTLSDLRKSYPVEINVYTTAAGQTDINCTAVLGIIRKASPFLRPIVCQHEVTPSELAQIFHHRFEVRDLTKCSPKSCEVQTIPGYMGPLILKVQFDASICGQLFGQAEYRAVVFRINSLLNGLKADCPTIRYTKTKDAFDKVPHEGYYYATVSGQSHVDVCRKAKKHLKHEAHICEEIQKVNRTCAQNKQRTFRMRLVQPIYLSDIPWYMNEHSKFVHYLNSRSSKCRFNGYVQLNENSR